MAPRRQPLQGFEGRAWYLPQTNERTPRTTRLRSRDDALLVQAHPPLDLQLSRHNLLFNQARDAPATDHIPHPQGGASGVICVHLCILAAKGPTAGAFGHLQTLVDLINEWSEVEETIFWCRKAGDTVKSVGNKKAVQADTRALSEEVLEEDLIKTQSIALAGTAASMLEEVSYDEVYMSRQVSQ